MKSYIERPVLTLAMLALSTLNHPLSTARAQGTGSTFQGQLQLNGSPVTGIYNLTATLYNAPSGGGIIAGPITNSAVPVTNGLFTVTNDFGATPWNGQVLWLETGAATNGTTTFAVLGPRQQVTPVPYAIFAESTVVSSLASGAAVGAGLSNTIAGGVSDAFIGGGFSNAITGGDYATIGGGDSNTVSGGEATIGGGTGNTAGAPDSTVGGGLDNTAATAWSTVAGGRQNSASLYGFVGGGYDNNTAQYAVVGGGYGNVTGAEYATVGGGQNNQATGIGSFIGGGYYNTNSGAFATIPGGYGNIASGAYSFAAGSNAIAANANTFVWSDGSTAQFSSTANNQFLVQASGGVRFVTSGAGMTLDGQPVLAGSSSATPAANVSLVLNMVWILPGTFIMGDTSSDPDFGSDEGPQTVVTLTNGFWMGQHPVTQGEYLAVMGSNPSYFTGDLSRPVEQVAWTDATNFCGTLTQREQSAGRLPAGWVYRLPTEAEWEYCCRALNNSRFYFGDDPGDTASLTNYAWYDVNSAGSTQPVGKLLPNAWGLVDMAGNVFEWCQDWYGAYPGGSVTNPQGPASGSNRVFRGGSGDESAEGCRSAERFYGIPSNVYYFIGFRVVLAPGQ